MNRGLALAFLLALGCGSEDPTDDGAGGDASSAGSETSGPSAGPGGSTGSCGACAGTCSDGVCLAPASIRFDDLAFDDVVTTQYADLATFSILGTGAVRVADYEWAYVTAQVSSLPNWICPGDVCGGCCNQDMAIDFTFPVRNLRFVGVGVDSSGKVAEVHVFQGDAEIGVVDVVGSGSDDQAPLVDLSVYQDVTRIEIRNITDSAGLGWDDFEFDTTS
jgi:hypothetical protein